MWLSGKYVKRIKAKTELTDMLTWYRTCNLIHDWSSSK